MDLENMNVVLKGMYLYVGVGCRDFNYLYSVVPGLSKRPSQRFSKHTLVKSELSKRPSQRFSKHTLVKSEPSPACQRCFYKPGPFKNCHPASEFLYSPQKL